MAGTEKIFRVFVSSTFADMIGERTVLQERVFPRLEAYCRERGGRFKAIDLRWGVSMQSARDRRTMNICLEEVHRCRRVSPALNFLALIGDRYGWLLLPAEIDEDDFSLICAAAPLPARDALRRAYRIDDNAVPRRFLLAPQDDARSVDESDAADIALQALIAPAVTAAFPERDRRRVAYGASATHLEIVARLAGGEDGGQGVLCYFRQSSDGGAEADESVDRDMLDRLKQDLASRVGKRRIRHYEPGDASAAALDAFADRVEADLKRVVRRELADRARRPPLDRELDEQQRFARERARLVLGRDALLSRLRDYLGDDSTEAFVLCGTSGSGKSSVMARAALDAGAAGGPAVVVARFVGATPDTADVELLLRSLCAEIGRAYGDDVTPPPRYHELEKEWQRRLAAATASQPLIVFIDGLDQIDPRDAGQLLPWLPRRLPRAVKMVVSVLDDPGPGGDCLRTMRQVLHGGPFVPLDPLSGTDAGRLLEVWLAEADRTLQPAQRSEVLGAYGRCPVPLFLRVAFEAARLWRSFDPPAPLEPNVDRLARQFYLHLGSAGQHGPELVRETLRCLCAARYGLAEDEILALLSANARVAAELVASSPHSPRVSAVPFVVWSRLRFAIAPYLAERAADDTAVLTFFHRALRTAAESLSGEGDREAAHGRLADFFTGTAAMPQPLRFAVATDGAGVPNRRKLSELPYQETAARRWPALIGTLSDLAFVQAKCGAGMTGDLVADYDRALREMGTDPGRPFDAQRAALGSFRSFVQRERATFDAHGAVEGLVFQQAHNQHGNEAVTEAWTRADPIERGRRWFRIDRPAGDELLVATLERHQKGVTDCSFDASGELLVSSGMDGAVLAWRTSDWSVTEVIAELGDSADSCAVSADGSRVGTACADGYVRIHDRRSRRTIVCEGAYELSPRRCRFAQGDELLVSVGRFGLEIHDARSGRLLRHSLTEHTINDCTIGPGTRVAAGDCAESVLVYDAADGSLVQQMYLDVRRVQGAVYSPDGRRLLATGGTFSAQDDMAPFGVTRLWDVGTWQELEGHDHRHGEPALNCAFLDEGRAYVIGLGDGTIELYDTAAGGRIGTVKGHDKGVRGLALSPDGTQLVTASFDGRLKVWRTSALLSGEMPASASGRGLFAAVAADGARGWAITGTVDRFHCDFDLQQVDFGAVGPAPHRLPRSRDLATLQLQRRDPMSPMQAAELTLSGIGTGAGHRSSPVPGDGTYWLVHDSARMWPSVFHMMPAIPASRWSPRNRAWARSPDGRSSAVVRVDSARVENASGWTVAVLLFDQPRAKTPVRTCERHIDISRSPGQCSYSADGRTVRLAVGSELWEIAANGRGTMRTLSGASADLVGFAESPGGAVVAAACADGTVCCWETASGSVIRAFAAHAGEARDCAFVAERELVSIGADGTMRLWNLRNAELQAVFVAETSLAALAASPRRRRVLALDGHGRSYFVNAVRERARRR